MALVNAFYQIREDGTKLVNYQRVLNFHSEICEVIANYPWERELKLSIELKEGSGLVFSIGDMDGIHASYEFTPVEVDKGVLSLDVVLKPGFLGIFGRKKVSVDFDVVSIAEAKQHIKQLFEYSIESIYQKYRK